MLSSVLFSVNFVNTRIWPDDLYDQSSGQIGLRLHRQGTRELWGSHSDDCLAITGAKEDLTICCTHLKSEKQATGSENMQVLGLEPTSL